MGSTVVRAPFGAGEVEALSGVRKLAEEHGHCLWIRPAADVWTIVMTDPDAKRCEIAEIHAQGRCAPEG
ncbi:hypothetical protein [Methylobacterium pseudosasicola]|uniref:Uncharacterized protein n=1 Tax=Methylobacterium pseudosasicola TaxID=582667 RepID=A0A1I4UEF8_9HYPH|nr:hypothetical protein [Methylobacterium pseudosasicola]SFM87180.1 hypothetical protein SAMN05192568_106820 [Methylobacterium pseudosasicola]